MSSDPSPVRGWLSEHGRTLTWCVALFATGWLPLAWVGWHWWEYSDEVYPPVRPYEVDPADKLADVLRGEGPPLIFAHRGDHLFAGQNSLESFERAVERGYDGIELDVVNTDEDVPVVAHNLHLGEEQLFVPEATVDDVRAHAEQLPAEHGSRHATLAEVLDRFGGETLFVVEIKATEESSFGAAAPVCDVVRAHDAQDTVILSSLKYHVIQSLDQTAACDGIARMYEVSGGGGDPPEPYELPILGLRHDFLTERKNRYSDAVQAFSVYTPNRTFHIARAMEDGALIIQTDRPGRALRIRAEELGWQKPR